MGWPARAKINLWGRRRRACATRSLRKAILRYGRSKRPFKGQPVLRAADRGAHPRICREPGRSPLKLYSNLDKIRRPSKIESTRVAKPRGPLEEESVPRKPLEEDPVLRAPRRLQKSIWTPGRHQAGKDLWTAWGGEQERTIWTAREAPGRHQGCIWDSLGGTREVPGGQERTFGQPARHQGGTREAFGTAWEAPGRCQGGGKGPFGQPGRHQGGRKGPIGQPARHQGGTREAGKDLWTAWEAPGRHQGLLKANLFDGKAWCQV